MSPSGDIVGVLPGGKGVSTWWSVFSGVLLATAVTRFYKVNEPAWVCWDETHFGKMASWYINRTFFFDVHPPLGKMMIAGMGALTGYNGTHPFEKPGQPYEDNTQYLGMRIGCTLLGCAIVPFSFLTVWEMTNSLLASFIAAVLLVFDIGVITLNRYILLDPILLFFISGSVFATAEFRSCVSHPFSRSWWFWLILSGCMLAGAISVKFVGLFVVLYVGIFTISQLWDILGDLSQPFLATVKHFLARAVCLIALPLALYTAAFFLHLSLLSKTGNGDGFYSSLFQSSLEGNRLYNATMPKEVAYGAVITLKNHRVGGGYLHSHFHLYPEGSGAKQQQVTTYAHKDENNQFVMKKWNEEPPNNTDSSSRVELVRNGDLVRLEHRMSRRNIHSHNVPAPVSKRHFQVTGYGENGTGDANDVWRLEIVGGREGEVVHTVTSRLKLHHYFVKCVLTASTKTLPKWGFEQGEVSCNPTIRDTNSVWNIEDNHFSNLPNSSVSELRPGFLSKFLEAHQVMLNGNSALKPKEGEMTSRPWEWPINLRGQWFSVQQKNEEISQESGDEEGSGEEGSGSDVKAQSEIKKEEDEENESEEVPLRADLAVMPAGDEGVQHRVFLLGNPVIWWANIVFLVVFLLLYSVSALKSQRGVAETLQAVEHRERTLQAAGWLFLGWSLHYVPFWAMGRVLYVHHYYPALLFSSMLTGVLLDYLLSVLQSLVPPRLGATLLHTAVGCIVGVAAYSFYLFSPLVYGMAGEYAREANSSMHHLHWLHTWDF